MNENDEKNPIHRPKIKQERGNMKHWSKFTDNEFLTIVVTIASFIGVFWLFGYPYLILNQIKTGASFLEILDGFIFYCVLWVGVSFIPIIMICGTSDEEKQKREGSEE